MTTFFTKKRHWKAVFYHILAWMAFIGYEMSLLIIASVPPSSSSNGWTFSASYIICILLFYVNAHVILSRVSRYKNPFLLFIPMFLVEMIVYTFLAISARYFLIRHFFPTESYPITASIIARHVWRGLYFVIMSAAYWFALSAVRNQKKIARLEMQHEIQHLKAEKEKSELEKNLLQAKNTHLLTQLNPHLLFNTLNFVYNSVRKFSADAANGVALLADIMNHALSGTGKDGKIALGDEVEHVEKIIELCRLRSEYDIYLDLHIERNTDSQRLPPLLLVTLVENVLKHGDLTNPEHPAQIILKIQETGICLYTSNLKKNTDGNLGHQIGMTNTRQRLTEFYPEDAARLSIEDGSNFFTVRLCIPNKP